MSGFDFDVIQRSWLYLFTTGMKFTLTLTFAAMFGGIVFGTLLAMMRLSHNKLISFVATSYVNMIRSVPLVLVIFWFYFLVPFMGAWLIGASEIAQRDGRLVEMYSFVAVVYFAMSFGLSYLVKQLQRKVAIIR